MTYSDWRAELSEGVKTRLLMKSLKGAGKLATKLGKKVTSSIDDIGTTKAKQGRNIFIKNRDGTKIQNPNVKPLTPDYQNLGQVAKGEGQLRLLNTRNKNLKVTNPLPKQDPSTVPAKGSSGPNRSEIKKKNTEAMKRAQALKNQQNSLKRQGRDGLQVTLLKKSDYPKRVQKYLGDDFDNFSKIQEDAMAAPTNNVGGGKIAGTVEAGDDPPVKKKKKKKGKKKTYAYGGRGSRKMWMA